MNVSKYRLPPWLKSSGITVAVLLVTVSCFHASWFLWKTTPNGWLKYAMIAMIIGLFSTSHLLAHLFGHGWKQGKWFLIMCLIAPTIIVLETISVVTTSAATDSRVQESARSENLDSPEYKAHMRSVNNTQAQIEALQKSMNELDPVRGRTARNGINDKISRLQSKQDAAQKQANSVNVSSTAQTYANLESSTGMSSHEIALLIAIMMSVAPIIMSVAVAALDDGEDKPVKKQKPDLRVVEKAA